MLLNQRIGFRTSGRLAPSVMFRRQLLRFPHGDMVLAPFAQHAIRNRVLGPQG